MSSEDAAKTAAQARIDLEQALTDASNALAACAQVMQACSVTLAEAAQREATATANYVTILEQQISRQQSLS